jgi:hypothetical protein
LVVGAISRSGDALIPVAILVAHRDTIGIMFSVAG